MNLRESLNSSDHGDPLDPDVLTGHEDYHWVMAYVHGWAEAKNLRIAVSTNGATVRLHNLSADTRSAKISRRNLNTRHDIRVAVQAQLDALPYWDAESDDWGPDPWPDPEVDDSGPISIRRERVEP